MTKNLFEFSIDKENNALIVKREFKGSLPQIWKAYTTPEILDKWWAPKPWRAKSKSLDFKAGGKWLYAMVGPEGEEHWAIMEYIEILHHISFTAIDSFTDSDGNINKDLPQSNFKLQFEEYNGNCLVTNIATYEKLEDLETVIAMGMQEGLTIAMEGLDALIEEGL